MENITMAATTTQKPLMKFLVFLLKRMLIVVAVVVYTGL